MTRRPRVEKEPEPTQESEQDNSKQHLNLPGMSQRGVRMRVLPPDVIRKVEDEGAKLAGAEATFIELRNSQVWQGICRMIVEVTEEPVEGNRVGQDGQPVLDAKGKPVPRTVHDGDVKWHKLNFTELSTPASDWYLNEIFTAKDISFFEHLYKAWHEVTQFELNELLGKASPAPYGG